MITNRYAIHIDWLLPVEIPVLDKVWLCYDIFIGKVYSGN